MVLLMITVLFVALTAVAYAAGLGWGQLRFLVAASGLLAVTSFLRWFVARFETRAVEPDVAERTPETEASGVGTAGTGERP